MNKLVRPVSAIVFAATIAGALTILPGFSDRVDASTSITAAIAATPVPVTSDDCADHHWPYIAASCLRDSRKAEGRARPVARVVNIDRKMAER
jgi:hypothetical protein